jgi:DNA mismatch repair protein MutL
VGKIRVLPEVVASQVAAGEVVERPASVIKELMENSLDAGARSLEIEVRGAGTGLLRVTDDGGGMDREDALLALERHATSKIATAGDLALVQTMGFRGEALPSIASVSEFTLRTRPAEAAAGTEAVVKGGKMVAVRDAGCAPGTTVEVKSLWRVRVCRCIMSAMGGPFFAPARRGIPRGG